MLLVAVFSAAVGTLLAACAAVPTPVDTSIDAESAVVPTATRLPTASPTAIPTATLVPAATQPPTATLPPAGPPTYTLTMGVSSTGGGSTYPDPGSTSGYAVGSVVKIDAMDATGYRFVNWTGPVTNPFSHNTNVTMTGNLTVTANFEQVGQDDVAIALDRTTWAVGRNNHFWVAINTSVAPGQKVDSVEAHIDFDPAYVQVDDASSLIDGIQIQPGPFFSNVSLNTVDNANGHIDFSASATTPQSSTREMLIAGISFGAKADTGPLPTAIRISKTPPRRSAMHFDEVVLHGPSFDCLATIGGKYGSYYLTMGLSPEGGGTTNPSSPSGFGPESAGSVISVSARPAAGYTFANWTGPVADPNNPNTTVTLNSNVSVTANFVQSG
ncbi:MAG: hypothetical protein Q7T04_07205 [Dehalococcoidia bacterium]|nr:hypothetical protein [Dehalococcoidia bacterium]